jgi:hypothetical protein
MAERDIQAAIRLALGLEPDLVLWRNSVGYTEEFSDKTCEKRGIRYGLGEGSADLIGVLAPSGRLFCLEVKTPKGRTTKAQDQWGQLVRQMGAFCAVVRSPEEAKAALDRAREGDDQ